MAIWRRYATADDHPCAPLARTRARGIGPCLPRSIQIVPRGRRRAFLDSGTIRRAESAECQSGAASGGVAVVKLVARLSSYGRRAVVVGGVADRYAGELARAGQSNRRRAEDWKRFAAACNEAAPLANRNGRRKSRNVWAGSRPIVPRVARERWAEIKMPRPGEDRSDVGGAAQFNNIGPVPLPASPRSTAGTTEPTTREGKRDITE